MWTNSLHKLSVGLPCPETQSFSALELILSGWLTVNKLTGDQVYKPREPTYLFEMRIITVRQTRQLLDSPVQFVPQASYGSSSTSQCRTRGVGDKFETLLAACSDSLVLHFPCSSLDSAWGEAVLTLLCGQLAPSPLRGRPCCALAVITVPGRTPSSLTVLPVLSFNGDLTLV